MRIVIDTNVLVSAVLKDKSIPAIAAHMAVERGVLLKSIATETQLFEVIARPYLASLIASAAHDWLAKLMAAAELVAINDRVIECRDPTDDKFLELAVNGRADFILTGDNDLLVLNPFRGIPVIAPNHLCQRRIALTD